MTTIAEFMDDLYRQADNIFGIDESNRITEFFSLECKGCGSREIEILGKWDVGQCYSTLTGCDPSYAKLVFKCRKCGKACMIRGEE